MPALAGVTADEPDLCFAFVGETGETGDAGVESFWPDLLDRLADAEAETGLALLPARNELMVRATVGLTMGEGEAEPEREVERERGRGFLYCLLQCSE